MAVLKIQGRLEFWKFLQLEKSKKVRECRRTQEGNPVCLKNEEVYLRTSNN